MASSWRGRTKCSWCGAHYGYRYGWDGKNIFVYTWDFLTFFWFWWHPHFCSNECKLAYQKHKGPIGIMRDIDFIKSVILFFKKPESSKAEAARDNMNIKQGFISKQQQAKTDEIHEEFSPAEQNEQKPIEVESPRVPAGNVPQIASQNRDVMSKKKPEENDQPVPQKPDDIDKFRNIMQTFIDTNGEQIFGKRIYWKGFTEKIKTNAAKGFKIPNGESMVMLLDASLTGSGKEGMVLTDWGIRYNDGVRTWSLTWNDLQEKYTITKTTENGALGVKADVLLLQAKHGDDFAVNKTINLSMAGIDYDILTRILNKTCRLFTGDN